jgi:hypothetical protein
MSITRHLALPANGRALDFIDSGRPSHSLARIDAKVLLCLAPIATQAALLPNEGRSIVCFRKARALPSCSFLRPTRLRAGRSADRATSISRGEQRGNVVLHEFVTFAAAPLELLSASDLNIGAAAGECAHRLKPADYQRDRGAAHAKHPRQAVLCQRNPAVVAAILNLK